MRSSRRRPTACRAVVHNGLGSLRLRPALSCPGATATLEGSAISTLARAEWEVAPPDSTLRRNRRIAGEVALVGVPVLIWAILIWRRRWMSDDGLIVLRTVRQIVAGNGPVFNVGERVETNTSVLWTWVLVVPKLLPGLSLNWAAVVLGLVLSVAGLAFALDGARRLWGADRRVVPAGALVVCALPPFWDFGTSGLETGLVFGWLGFTWWLLVRLAQRRGAGLPVARVWPTGVVLGLGPLVRPDLALVTVTFGVVLIVLVRQRGIRRLLGAAAVALALPVAYQLFRVAYYGVLVPASALAKEAAEPRWDQGLGYLRDLVDPYLLWIPAVLLVVAAVLAWTTKHPTPSGRGATALLVATPVLVSIALATYVVRVGGDFMHGRMLLPALFCALLPVMALPLTRLAAVPLVALLGWSIVCALALRTDYGVGDTEGIADERLYYVTLLQKLHPVVVDDHRRHPFVPEGVRLLGEEPSPSVAIYTTGSDGPLWLLLPARASRDTLVFTNLGISGELAPLGTRVLDQVGLSHPLAAHSRPIRDARPGHSKELSFRWYGADDVVPGAIAPLDTAGVAAARSLLECPSMADLVASYRAPLTVDRMVANVRGATERTALRYPRDPVVTFGCAGIG